jgi:hypothetical protein
MSCSNCNSNLSESCNNPCGTGAGNTAQCESLPSQIQNFTDQFFGSVVKTEVNGQVVWSLPCSLDIGLPANPRAVGEGLACYFLRLFRDGISGLMGPKGNPGTPGANGRNAFSVTTQAFGQPSINNPFAQIVIVPNPSIVAGLGVFIQNSGYYQVTNVAPGGVVFVTLLSPLPSAPAVIPAGSIVTPGAAQGATGLTGTQGPQGLVGPQGVQGAPGVSFTGTNGQVTFFDSSGNLPVGALDYIVTAAWANVDFTSGLFEFAPAAAGTYLINVAVSVQGTVNVLTTDVISLTLASSTGANYYTNMTQYSGVFAGEYEMVPITAIITFAGGVGEKLRVRAKGSDAGRFAVFPAGSMVRWVRIA